MSQTFEDWLEKNRTRDENVIKGEESVEDLRQKLRERVVNYFDETKDQVWCNCDVCVLIRITADEKKPDRLIDNLALIGLEYLLGKNFNGTAAMYYYSYVEKERE